MKILIYAFIFFSISFIGRCSDYEINAMDFYPAHYFNKEKNKVDGVIIQIITEAYAEVGKSVSFNLLPIKRCINELNDTSTLACATIPVSANSNFENFIIGKESIGMSNSNLYLVANKSAYKLKNKKFNYKDLANKTVSFFNTKDLKYVDRLNRYSAKLDPVMDDMIVIKLLLNHRTDFGLVYQQTYKYLPNSTLEKIIVLDIFDTVRGYVAFNKKNKLHQQAVHDLDNGLRKLKQKKRIEEINFQWKNVK